MSKRLSTKYYRTLVIIVLFTNVCLLPDSTLACGPGRGGIRRRGARKLTPLVYKQHEPNFSERSLAASGMPEGYIDRTSEKFRHLVPNYSPDIIFKDEEGTGADRLMTQRCKEKLNNLATTVMNQWSGIQLRVTEAWDEDRHHAEQSLHYEGRAVDLTTSDRDRTKYGLLARLAVEAGFDWVYYESRAHIHASCKSESFHQSKNGGCFPGTSQVVTSEGKRKAISELEIGEEILTSNEDGSLTFSPVILFLDKDPDQHHQYFVIETESGEKLTLTPSHLIYAHVVEDGDEEVLEDAFQSVYASYVREGDFVLVTRQGQLKPSKIISIETKIMQGVYAPLTVSGNLVVDGTLASCYAVISSQGLAHTAFAPLRWTYNLGRIFSSQALKQEPRSVGVHWYADFLYSLAKNILPKSMLR